MNKGSKLDAQCGKTRILQIFHEWTYLCTFTTQILREINFCAIDDFRTIQFWFLGICLNLPKLISRKNQVTGNFFNFHTVQACNDAYFKNTFDGFACQKNPSIEAAWNLCDLWFEWQIFMECCLVRMQQTSREWSSRGHGNYFEIETLDITSNTPQHKKEHNQMQVESPRYTVPQMYTILQDS